MRAIASGTAGLGVLWRHETGMVVDMIGSSSREVDELRKNTGLAWSIGAGAEFGRSRWAPRAELRVHSLSMDEGDTDWLSLTTGVSFRSLRSEMPQVAVRTGLPRGGPVLSFGVGQSRQCSPSPSSPRF